MAINLSQIRDLLLPGVYKVTGAYEEIPTQWSKVFRQAKSKMAVERSVSVRMLGLPALKNEGSATAFDNSGGERYVYNQSHQEVGLGYAITRKAIADNLYKTQFNPSNLGLARVFHQFKEIQGASILNTANVFNQQIGGDGVSLVNPSHPIDGATVANQPTIDVDLNESSLLSAMIQIRRFKDNAGIKIFARGRRLVVPLELEYVALRLLKTAQDHRPGTADNDINALLASGGLPEGHVVLDFLTSPFAWFILTNHEGLVYMEREPFETDMWVDNVTDNLLVKGYERYSFGYFDWRSIWGTFPTS